MTQYRDFDIAIFTENYDYLIHFALSIVSLGMAADGTRLVACPVITVGGAWTSLISDCTCIKHKTDLHALRYYHIGLHTSMHDASISCSLAHFPGLSAYHSIMSIASAIHICV